MTIQFRAVPMPTAVADATRASRAGPFGQPVEQWVSEEGRLPCRHCLEEVPAGRSALLFSYSPFAGEGPYAERGPVFVCAEACTPFATANEMPEAVTSRLVNIRAYDAKESMLYRHSQVAAGGEAATIARAIFADPEVATIHIRTARNGCFLCAVERAG